jgi:hypothetical protein
MPEFQGGNAGDFAASYCSPRTSTAPIETHQRMAALVHAVRNDYIQFPSLLPT